MLRQQLNDALQNLSVHPLFCLLMLYKLYTVQSLLSFTTISRDLVLCLSGSPWEALRYLLFFCANMTWLYFSPSSHLYNFSALNSKFTNQFLLANQNAAITSKNPTLSGIRTLSALNCIYILPICQLVFFWKLFILFCFFIVAFSFKKLRSPSSVGPVEAMCSPVLTTKY